MIRREPTREEKVLSPSRNKGARHGTVVAGRGEKSLLCVPGSELRLGGAHGTYFAFEGCGKLNDDTFWCYLESVWIT